MVELKRSPQTLSSSVGTSSSSSSSSSTIATNSSSSNSITTGGGAIPIKNSSVGVVGEGSIIHHQNTSPNNTISNSLAHTTTSLSPSSSTANTINRSNEQSNNFYNTEQQQVPLQITPVIDYLNNNHIHNEFHKRGSLYWCWLLKEYIRLGHAKSMQRVLRILDQIDPYIFQWSDAIYNPSTSSKSSCKSSSSSTTSSTTIPSSSSSTTSTTTSSTPTSPSSINDSINSIYTINVNSKPIINTKRLSFPHIYIPNLLRLRSDLFKYFNKNFSYSNILTSLSTGNVESLLRPKYIPVPKSIPIVPFLLIIVYVKYCLSKKGEGLQEIINVLLDCQLNIHLLPVYDYPNIKIEVLIENIMLANIRFIDWDPISMKLLPTEVYLNEIFETFYLGPRESLFPAPSTQKSTHPTPMSPTPPITYPTEDYHFKMINTYLQDSRKMVFYNIRYLTQRRSSFELSTWTEENVGILLKCTVYHLNQYCIGGDLKSTTSQDLLMILDSCLRLSLSWVSIVSGLQDVKENQEQSWWIQKPKKIQPILKQWLNVIETIFEQVQLEKLLLIGLVWLGITVSLFDESDENDLNNSYYLFIKYIKKYPDMLSDYNKSSLVIKSIGFALIGVQTIEQTTELINIMSSLWDDPKQQQTQTQQPQNPSQQQLQNQQQPQQQSNTPSLDNGWLVFKTIQSVFTSKFKPTNFLNQTEMENAILDWIKVICEESYNSFYKSYSNSKYLSIFISSSISNILQKGKCKFIPLESKNIMVNQIHDIFYSSIYQINYLSNVQKIGVVTSYCLSGTEPFKDKQACQHILKIIIDIFLNQVLGINNNLADWLEKPSEINNLIIKQMENHQTSPIFLSLLSFVSTITKLMIHLKDNDVNKEIMLKLCEYSYRLNDAWYVFIRENNMAFPRGSIQRSLKPTFNGFMIGFSSIFSDIAKILSPTDSALGLEFFLNIGFITEDDVPIVNNAIKTLVRNVSMSDCAIIRFIDKMPPYLLVPKDDKIACSKVIIYLNSLASLVTSVSHDLIVNQIVPNLFEYMEYPNEKINRLTHIIISRIFSIPNFHLALKMVPKYLSTSLKTFPSFTHVSSFFTGVSSIVEHNEPTNPMILYSVKTISQAAIQHIKLLQDKPNLNSSSKGLFQLLLSMLQLIDVQILDLVLSEIKNIVFCTNPNIRLELCTALLSEITGGNFENSKKNMCLSWYLNLINDPIFRKSTEHSPPTPSKVNS